MITAPERFVHSSFGEQTTDYKPIRLLRIQPASDYYSPLEVSLEEVNLLSEPEFKALSYVWGDPKGTIPILLCGKTYEVTANCHAALLRLRQIGDAPLWIDAISVNQKDEEEKLQQIHCMRDIFYSAREVIVWLGYCESRRQQTRPSNEEETDRILAELLEELERLTDTNHFHKFEEVLFDGPDRFRAAEAFVDLLKHPWFERLWVHQEVCLAKQAFALTRFRVFPMRRIFGLRFDQINIPRVFKRLGRKGQTLAGLIERGAAFRSRAISIAQYDRKLKRITSSYGTVSLFKQVTRYKCHDPRDRIFGVLGLLDDYFISQFNPEVVQSLPDLLVATTRALIQERGSLYAMTLARGSSVALPTWVVDWEHNSEASKEYCYSYNSYNSNLGYPKAVSLCPQGCLELKLIGLSVNTVINHTLEPLIQRDTDDIGLVISAQELFLELWRKDFSKYPGGLDAREAALRTVTADIDYLDGFVSSKTRILEKRVLLCQQTMDAINKKRSSIAALDLDKVHISPDLTDNERAYLVAMGNHLKEMKFFISNLGYMGTCPIKPQIGDKISVLPGSKMPVLLRNTNKKENQYTLVGPCFVWGLMDGEAFQDKDSLVLEGKSFEDLQSTEGWETFELI